MRDDNKTCKNMKSKTNKTNKKIRLLPVLEMICNSYEPLYCVTVWKFKGKEQEGERVGPTHSNVADLQAPQVPQLLDHGSDQFRLLPWELRNHVLQQRVHLGQTVARSHPDT